MDKHPYFSSPAITHRNKSKQYRVVGYSLEIGQELPSPFEFHMDGKMVIKTVDEILDTKISAGIFDNYERPNSYLVTVK